MNVSKKNILDESVEIKKFIEKNKKIPTYATINNSKFTPAQYTYLLTKLLNNLNTASIEKLSLKEPSNSFGQNINEKVVKDDYLDMCKRVLKYIEANKQPPNYVKTKNSKILVKYELYIYCFAKILSYYKEHQVLPNYCLFNSNDLKQQSSNNVSKTSASSKIKNIVKKITKYIQSKLLTTKGCKGMAQCTNYFCACNALQQMFYSLTGILVPEKDIARWASTTTSGTSHAGIETAVAKFNKTYKKNLKIIWKNFSDLGDTKEKRFEELGKLFINPNKAVFCHLLYRDKYGHYEVPKSVDTSSKMLEIMNSLGTKNNDGSYQGYVELRDYTTQARYIAGISQKSICIIYTE